MDTALPRESSAGRSREVTDGVDQTFEHRTLTDDERATLAGDREALVTLAERLPTIPTPARSCPRSNSVPIVLHLPDRAVQDSIAAGQP
jgi:hypothetical protein